MTESKTTATKRSHGFRSRLGALGRLKDFSDDPARFNTVADRCWPRVSGAAPAPSSTPGLALSWSARPQ
jgi:hypothetical protein